MKTIAICDDSKEWLGRATEIVNDYLQKHDRNMQVLCYNDIDSCIEELPTDAGVLFMDIEWEQTKPSRGGPADGSNIFGSPMCSKFQYLRRHGGIISQQTINLGSDLGGARGYYKNAKNIMDKGGGSHSDVFSDNSNCSDGG